MNEDYKQKLIEILSFLIHPIDESAEFEIMKEGDQWRVNINTEKEAELAGHRHKVSNSIQHVARVLIHQNFPDDRTHFLLDINGKRLHRERVITEKIPQIGKKYVLKDGIPVVISGLSSYERKIVHGILGEAKGLETTSVGERDNRKLIIRPTSDSGVTGIDNAEMFDIKDLLKSVEDSLDKTLDGDLL